MSKKIAINGFGRIGRLVAKVLLSQHSEDIEIVAINDLTSTDNLAYLLGYDTVMTYSNWQKNVASDENNIYIKNVGKENKEVKIKVFSERDPEKLPWRDLDIDVVVESTGFFTDEEGASKHLMAGAKKVVISAPAKSSSIPTVVLGVNKPNMDAKILSNASCTTNCIAPVLKVINDAFGIKQAFGITAHAYTATQNLQDAPSRKDFRDGRAAAVNAIPSSTGAAKAVFEVIPELKGKVSLSALRIPVITGSMVYVTAQLEKNTTVEEFNQTIEKASQKEMLGILEYSTADLVSSDIITNPHSSIFDAKLTEIMNDTVKFVVWYDNEWGYSNRLAELVSLV
jgi:glyceraldehyde 3-phosphate dehydrogenase